MSIITPVLDQEHPMEYIPEFRPLHMLAILVGMVLGIRRGSSSRQSVAGWALAAGSATAYVALVVRDRRRNVRWRLEHNS
ncbi:hypothetical protein ACH9D2_11395 [Kocuria sp. M4R2S49]|uniref:hypothetical protein n=1 Tax=Kocuria rhizosphaericola TaxID=3376284 RepID=UPI0037AAD1B6